MEHTIKISLSQRQVITFFTYVVTDLGQLFEIMGKNLKKYTYLFFLDFISQII